MIPGSNQYNWEFKVHGIDVSIYDMPALNGALHVVNDVLCPRHSNGRNENQNDEDWTEWKEWLRKWHHDQ
ncbi:hypothetical protein FRC03_004538 [Tulasnella sp. 419]|nr:hypothetical protein FRC03_004538 [Tulasnella sp. 419]